jgi:hypothetical protein
MLWSAGAEATPVSELSFTTSPAAISVVNEFGPDLFPTDSYTISVNTTIGSAVGAPNLVGQSLSFSYFIENGFNPGVVSSLKIGGTEVLFDPLLNDGEFLLTPPIASSSFDLVSGKNIFGYTAPFQDFGPRLGDFPDILMDFVLDKPLPTKTGFEYCTLLECEFSTVAGLTAIGGDAVVSTTDIVYTEGTISEGTLTFSAVGGIAKPSTTAPVPVPAAGPLMLAGLLASGVMLRRRRRQA